MREEKKWDDARLKKLIKELSHFKNKLKAESSDDWTDLSTCIEAVDKAISAARACKEDPYS